MPREYRELTLADRATIQDALLSSSMCGSFLAAMRDRIRDGFCLTNNQLAACEQILEGNVAAEADNAVLREAHAAMWSEVAHIPNGVFTLSRDGQHLTFRISTIRRGNLAGKRVLQLQGQYLQFRSFASLYTDGTIRVWRNSPWSTTSQAATWARALVTHLHHLTHLEMLDPDFNMVVNDVFYGVVASTFCRRCNRTLTTPTSIAAGIGPECSTRDHEDTVRANPAAGGAPRPSSLREPVVAPVARQRMSELTPALVQ